MLLLQQPCDTLPPRSNRCSGCDEIGSAFLAPKRAGSPLVEVPIALLYAMDPALGVSAVSLRTIMNHVDEDR